MKEVRIEVLEDESRYFGHALITFHDAHLPESPHRLLVSRKSTDTPYLGPDGWQASPIAMDVELVSRSDSKVILRAGPAVCDRIPYSLYVRLQVENAETFGQAFWPEIMQSPKGYSGTLSEPPTIPPKTTEIEALVEEQPELLVVRPPLPAPVEPTVTLKKTEPEAEKVEAKEKRKRSYAWAYILLLLILAGGGGFAYWKWGPLNSPDSPLQEAEATTPTDPSESLSAKFERLKASDDDGDELLSLTEEAFDAGDTVIANQAINISVARGNTTAKLTQAKWYDPRTFDDSRVQAIDANRAARAYFELALGGNAEAKSLLTSICEASKSSDGPYRDFFGSTYCQGSLDP
ncbi:hypothetical protein FA04_03025 [Ensifer adhaerens]|uniref:Uncharacterized protein n=1 Tax=Ensifer adhaerens TaxID=106592 RepID=A0ABY8HII7_ENSAD|nr:hypothetical protein [Ensifer adhaerens]ANK71695.1 hypothetical protein FA04_03025 [Ensifer adhaerens]KDP71579.1 hypothetical protein FA04_22165 [Ensifer adhaerens]WFP91372.1 hypothetical protein P4B07_03050 [Ensifer adhaerens]